MANEFQKEFDKQYITGHEIEREMGVTRTAILYARRRGALPYPVIVHGSGTFIWNRKALKPFLEAWKISLAVRRGEKVSK